MMDQKLPEEITEELLKYTIEGKIHKVYEDSDTFKIIYIIHDVMTINSRNAN